MKKVMEVGSLMFLLLTCYHCIAPSGLPCKKNGETFCHGNVVRKYGRSYGNICDNGAITLMRMER